MGRLDLPDKWRDEDDLPPRQIAAAVDVTLSVVMPTYGRPSLWKAIASCVDQLEEGDELVVIADVSQPETGERVLAIVEDFVPCSLVYLEATQPGSCFGNAQRDAGMAIASGSHLLFLDDDDVYAHGALDKVRWEIAKSSSSVFSAHVFRAEWGSGHHARGTVLWADRELRVQNVAPPMVVLPNRRYGCSWMSWNHRGAVSDFPFLEAAIGECDGVEWHTDVVCTVRP